jgi:hypothetical protein
MVAVLSDENPFEPRREGVPLQLSLDARSLGRLSQEDRERAEFLCELCLTPAVDGLWTWDGMPLVAGLPQTELRPLVRDDRAVGLVGAPHEFIGGVAMWSRHERVAEDYGFEGAERDWFLYYSTTTQFHTKAGDFAGLLRPPECHLRGSDGACAAVAPERRKRPARCRGTCNARARRNHPSESCAGGLTWRAACL